MEFATRQYWRMIRSVQSLSRDLQPDYYTHMQIFCDMPARTARHNIPASNLLAELLQVGDHAVAQAILHVVGQQVRCSHDSQSLPQSLWKEHSDETSAACMVFT